MGDLSMDPSDKGRLLSAIAAGYLLTQVPGGAMADRFGAKRVISFALAISASLCFMIPFAADNYGLAGVWFTIALMGAAQGPFFPTSTVYLSRWLPKQGKDGVDEKAWGTTMLDLGVTVGSMVVLPVANALAETVGWRQAYRCVSFAAFAFVTIGIQGQLSGRHRALRWRCERLRKHARHLRVIFRPTARRFLLEGQWRLGCSVGVDCGRELLRICGFRVVLYRNACRARGRRQEKAVKCDPFLSVNSNCTVERIPLKRVPLGSSSRGRLNLGPLFLRGIHGIPKSLQFTATAVACVH